jgi:anti-anti-sigma factor
MESLQTAFEESADSSTCHIRLSGDMTISHALSLHQTLLSTTEKYPQVEITLQNVVAFDVSAIQLLLATVNDSTTKVRVSIGENADCVKRWLATAGLPRAFEPQSA